MNEQDTFRRELIQHLDANDYEFWHQGGGGCETCGYGGEGSIDYPALLKEIDKFSAEFASKAGGSGSKPADGSK